MNASKLAMIAMASLIPVVSYAGETPAQPRQVSGQEGPFIITVQEEKPDNPAPARGGFQPGAAVGEEAQRMRQLQLAQRQLGAALTRIKQEKGSYLGVSATPAPAVLRKQLQLPEGMGLVVEIVVPESPAAKAGLQRFDVLQKLDEQLLINPQQLAVLVRSHKPGEEISLGIIRDGKPTTVSAKLEEREVEPLEEQEMGEIGNAGQPWRVIQLPREPQIRLKEILGGDRLRQGPSSSTTWVTGEQSFTLTVDSGGHRTFVARDKEGKTVFDGPIDTPEQREKLPPELKKKLAELENPAKPRREKNEDRD